ncbi:MAG: hypothetical protein R3C39_06560 [Dehalococcoidia bacterium]
MVGRTLFVAAFASVGLVLAGCEGGDASVDALTEDDLPLMVLPAEALGPDFGAFAVVPDSGYFDNSVAAEEFPLIRSANSLETLGRVSGYRLDYGPAYPPSEGVIGFQTSVELFTSVDGAERYKDDLLSGMHRWRLSEDPEFEIRGSDRLELSEVGDGGGAVLLQATLHGIEYGGLMDVEFVGVVFRSDLVVASINVLAIGDARPGLADDLAAALHDRIERVRARTVAETPVPIPPMALDPQRAAWGSIDPATLLLDLDDLPSGAFVTEEEPGVDFDGAPTYTRWLAYGSWGEIGQSRFDFVQTRVTRYPTPESASAALALARSELTGVDRRQVFEERYYVYDLGRVDVLEVDVGDEAFALGVSDGDPSDLRSVRVAMIWVRRGTVVSSVIVGGVPDAFDPVDMLPLADVMAERLDTAGGSGPRTQAPTGASLRRAFG